MAKEDSNKPVEEDKDGKASNMLGGEITEAEIIAAMSWQRDSGRLSRPASTQRLHNVTGGQANGAQGGDATEEDEEQNAEIKKGRG